MVEVNKQLSVSFLASFLITILSASFALFDSDNALWALPAQQNYDWLMNDFINWIFYLGPLASLLFYYFFEAEAETNEKTALTLKGVPNIEWWLRLLSQLILAVMWFLLARKHIILFLKMQCLFYVSLMAWDYVVVIHAQKKEMMHLLQHDTLGFIFTLVYSFLAGWLYNFRIEVAEKEQLTQQEVLILAVMIILMAFSVMANIVNIAVAYRRAKIRLRKHLLPRISGVRS